MHPSPLQSSLGPRLVLISPHTGTTAGRRDSRDQRFRIAGGQVLGQLDELRVGAPDITELGGPELGKVGLGTASNVSLCR
ncbi:hypothetical protein Tdes44962_MAKER09670 [Teratosphaeria destructans]|uniref:Uncharacterized protein n=1 Tax=Teratosphaeria destructans TaxID=418781 RepID=A0A9W7W2C4_9PEZI|nr:hypothetical protein Tdes44962_MAKER09670 [Teratosphaeria destructans]